jgi:two-component system sensor histidine kinase/response regulator
MKDGFRFSPDIWDNLFPFYILLDQHLTFLEGGSILRKANPNLTSGSPFAEHFAIKRPPRLKLSFEELVANTEHILVFESLHTPMLLRAQAIFLADSQQLLLLASPSFTETTELQRMGITLQDLPKHHAAWDFLTLLQIQRSALRDAQELAQMLQTQHKGLKQVNQRLQQQEAEARKLALVAARTENLVVLTDPQGRIEWVNPAFEKVTGYLLSEVKGLSPGSFLQGPETDPATVAYMSKHIQANEGFSAEVLNYKKSGKPYWISLEVQPIFDEDGEIMNFMAIQSDISERKQNAAELMRYSTALQKLQALSTDLNQNLEDKIRAILRLGLNTFGLEMGFITHINEEDLCIVYFQTTAPDHSIPEGTNLELSQTYCAQVIESGEMVFFHNASETDYRFHPCYQNFGFEAYIGTPLWVGDRLIGTLNFTARKPMRPLSDRDGDLIRLFSRWIGFEMLRAQDRQALSEAKEAAESANQVKTDFIANISHEIRTPLNAISGMTELMRETSLNAQQQQYLGTIWAGSQSLLHLINDLLDISKIEAGQVDIDSVEFDPEVISTHVMQILQSRIRSSSLDFWFVCNPCLPPPVIGDPNRIRQILLNLIGNAIKFTEKGAIGLRLNWRETGTGHVALSFQVEDSGIGIPPEDLERIFHKFTQVHEHSQSLGGIGLGLNIARSLAQAMNGRISVSSTPGQGSCFTLELEAPLAPSGRYRPRIPSSRLLLVASHEREKMIRSLLEAWHMQVEKGPWQHQELEQQLADYAWIALDSELPPPVLAAWAANHKNTDPPLLIFSTTHSGPTLQSLFPQAQCLRPPFLPEQLRSAFGISLGEPRLNTQKHEDESGEHPVSSAWILIAEDNYENRILTERWLELAGHRFFSAVDGREAVALTQQHDFDLILMDLQMPEMNGFEASLEIRAQEQQREREPVPIIAFTAHAVEKYRNEAFSAGMNDYITKPIRRDRLIAAVEKWARPQPVILSVDDDHLNHFLIEAYLKESEFKHFIKAGSAAEALNILARQRVSLMLLDMEMPIMNGYELATHLRKDIFLHKIPIVALTGHSGSQQRARCLNAGCTEYLEKPFSRGQLLKMLRNFLVIPSQPTPVEQRVDDSVIRIEPDIVDLVPMFIENSLNQIQKARFWLEHQDWDSLIRMGHSLKGSGASFGFQKASGFGKQLETLAIQHDDPAFRDTLEQLEHFLRTVRWAPA